VILGFRREADQNCALLGCYEAYSGNFLPAFRYQSVAFSGIKNNLLVLEPWKKGAHDDNDDDVVVVVVAVAVAVVVIMMTYTKIENCALRGYYAASSGNLLPTFRENKSVPSSRGQGSKTDS